jgi:glycosyltransferase involved in cell wall biosynthesis
VDTSATAGPARLRAVLVLATSTGGVGMHVRSLAALLVKRGVAVTVCGPEATQEHFDFTGTGAKFAPVEISSAPRPSDLTAGKALQKVVTETRAHVVHAHGLRAALIAGSALGKKRQGRTPLVVTLHNAVLSGGARAKVSELMEGRAVRGADVVLGASTDLVDRARALGATDARFGPVSAPPLPAPQHSREHVRSELGAGDRPILLAVGRLAPQKAYPLLLEAAERWITLDPVPLLVIAGVGPLRDELQERIDAELLPVRLLGHRDDVPDLFAAADIAVLPSEWEARSLTAQEALRTGVPLVATAVGGTPSLVGDAGVLVPYGDVPALAQAVADLIGDPKRREELAALGHEQAATWPDDESAAAQVLSVYEEFGPN